LCEATLETIYEDDDTEEQQQDLGEEGEEGNSEEEQEKEEEEEEEQEDDEHASPTFRKSLLELKSNNHRWRRMQESFSIMNRLAERNKISLTQLCGYFIRRLVVRCTVKLSSP